MTVYDLINELRARHYTPSSARALDMVVVELGRTGDNLSSAIANLRHEPVPPGGWAVLDELEARATAEGIADLEPVARRPLPGEGPPQERLDEATAGIGLLLIGSTILVFGLGILAAVAGVLKATGH